MDKGRLICSAYSAILWRHKEWCTRGEANKASTEQSGAETGKKSTLPESVCRAHTTRRMLFFRSPSRCDGCRDKISACTTPNESMSFASASQCVWVGPLGVSHRAATLKSGPYMLIRRGGVAASGRYHNGKEKATGCLPARMLIEPSKLPDHPRLVRRPHREARLSPFCHHPGGTGSHERLLTSMF